MRAGRTAIKGLLALGLAFLLGAGTPVQGPEPIIGLPTTPVAPGTTITGRVNSDGRYSTYTVSIVQTSYFNSHPTGPWPSTTPGIVGTNYYMVSGGGSWASTPTTAFAFRTDPTTSAGQQYTLLVTSPLIGAASTVQMSGTLPMIPPGHPRPRGGPIKIPIQGPEPIIWRQGSVTAGSEITAQVDSSGRYPAYTVTIVSDDDFAANPYGPWSAPVGIVGDNTRNVTAQSGTAQPTQSFSFATDSKAANKSYRILVTYPVRGTVSGKITVRSSMKQGR